jgi:hypothetical protein
MQIRSIDLIKFVAAIWHLQQLAFNLISSLEKTYVEGQNGLVITWRNPALCSEAKFQIVYAARGASANREASKREDGARIYIVCAALINKWPSANRSVLGNISLWEVRSRSASSYKQMQIWRRGFLLHGDDDIQTIELTWDTNKNEVALSTA